MERDPTLRGRAVTARKGQIPVILGYRVDTLHLCIIEHKSLIKPKN